MSNSASATQQRSGVFVDPFDPSPETILIEDIALGLSREPRYRGQTRLPWSVAAHSLLVSRMCSEENRLFGLLHDAAEYIFGDMGRPIKHDPRMASYREACSHLQKVILVKFGLAPDLPDEVKYYDDVLCVAEAEELHHGVAGWLVVPRAGDADVAWARRGIRDLLEMSAHILFLREFHLMNGEDVHAHA